MVVTSDYSGHMLFFFENGKAAKVELSAYQTKTNRKKLIKAYSDKSPAAAMLHIESDVELVIISSAGRHLLINTGAISPKTTKDTQGVGVIKKTVCKASPQNGRREKPCKRIDFGLLPLRVVYSAARR